MSSTEPAASPAGIWWHWSTPCCDTHSHPKLKSCSTRCQTELWFVFPMMPKRKRPREKHHPRNNAPVGPEQAQAPTLAPPALCSSPCCPSCRGPRGPAPPAGRPAAVRSRAAGGCSWDALCAQRGPAAAPGHRARRDPPCARDPAHRGEQSTWDRACRDAQGAGDRARCTQDQAAVDPQGTQVLKLRVHVSVFIK